MTSEVHIQDQDALKICYDQNAAIPDGYQQFHIICFISGYTISITMILSWFKRET